MSDQFKPGDVVQLKSGGPVMTVRDIAQVPGTVNCDWFEEGKKHSASFPTASLEIFDDGPPPFHMG